MTCSSAILYLLLGCRIATVIGNVIINGIAAPATANNGPDSSYVGPVAAPGIGIPDLVSPAYTPEEFDPTPTIVRPRPHTADSLYLAQPAYGEDVPDYGPAITLAQFCKNTRHLVPTTAKRFDSVCKFGTRDPIAVGTAEWVTVGASVDELSKVFGSEDTGTYIVRNIHFNINDSLSHLNEQIIAMRARRPIVTTFTVVVGTAPGITVVHFVTEHPTEDFKRKLQKFSWLHDVQSTLDARSVSTRIQCPFFCAPTKCAPCPTTPRHAQNASLVNFALFVTPILATAGFVLAVVMYCISLRSTVRAIQAERAYVALTQSTMTSYKV